MNIPHSLNLKINRITRKYFKIITVALLIPFSIMTLIALTYYTHILTVRVISQQKDFLYQFKSKFDKENFESLSLFNLLTQNEYIDQYFNLSDLYSYSGYESSAYFKQLSKIMTNMLLSNTNVSSIYLYNSNIEYVYSNRYSGYINSISDHKWYDLYHQNNEKNFVALNKETNEISFYFNFHTQNKKCGFIIINIDAIKFNNTYPNNYTIFITSKDGQIIQSNDLSQNNFPDIANPINADQLSEEIITSRVGNNVISLINSPNSSFIYIIKTNGVLTTAEYRNCILFIISSIIITLFLAIIVSIILSMELSEAVSNIMLLLEPPQINGNNKRRKKEFMYIINSIIKNSPDKIEQINILLTEKLFSLRKAQTIALQTQITPHFLYNTLQAINAVTLGVCKGDNDASKMIILFSNILHNTLDTENYLIPLEDEIISANDFIKLQEYKNKNRFNIVWHISDDTKQLYVVKLCLQPILENAITHGVLPINTICTINITSYIQNKIFYIEIQNDGLSITPEKLNEINAYLNDFENIKESNSIGLSNINQRIKLVFGKEYGCFLYSENGYTTTQLKMPVLSSNYS